MSDCSKLPLVGKYMKIYIDGIDKTGVCTTSFPTPSGVSPTLWRIGSASSGYEPLAYIDELMVFNRALTPEEAISMTIP